MKALVLEKVGSLDNLKMVEDRREPVPKNDEIKVKIKAAGLNPVDYKIVKGWMGLTWEEPPVLGLDAAGIVDEIGKDVVQFKVGDKVFYHGYFASADGAYAEYAVTKAHTTVKIPGNLEMEEAAAIPCAGFTAYQAVIKKLKIEPFKVILVHAGAGGVGGFAIQLAKLCNAIVITTCSTNNIEYVLALGADFVIDYNKQSVYEEVMNITQNKGCAYVVNTIDSETATKDVDLLSYGGQLVSVVDYPDFSRLNFYEKAISLHEVALGGVYGSNDRNAQLELITMGTEMAKLAADRKISSLLSKVISPEEIPVYLKKLEGRHVRGKIVAKFI